MTETAYPLISVVMCTYNGEKYVAEQLRSILAQTYPNIELIVCDDNSTDQTVSVVASYQQKHQHIYLYQNSVTLGFNKNFEKAIGFAKGDWIAIADQDDIWLPRKLEALFDMIESDTLLVHSYNAEFKNDDATHTFFNHSRVRFKGSKTSELFFYNTITGHTMLLHKNLLQAAMPFPAGVYYDWWLGVHASLISNVRLHPDALVLHRQHASNVSHIQKAASPEEVKATFFAQRQQTLEQFATIKNLPVKDKLLLDQFICLLQTESNKSFSFPVFFFFLRHARAAFYYRKKTPMFFYHLKYSLKRASMKVKNWT